MKAGWLGGVAACAIVCAFANTALAAEAAEATAATAGGVAEVVVYGRGESREVQSINMQEIETAAPGTSPIKVVQSLPGVNYTSSDPFGAYEWATRISIRGFNQNQLGFTLDGVPLGDMSYGNFNGLHISRAIINEDISQVVLAQGAGTLDTASTNNLGGTLKFVSRDPAETFGGAVAATGGSDDMHRYYVRLDSGELPVTGTRAAVSFADQRTDKWKGEGVQKQRQVDLKVVQPIGQATLTGFYDWSRRRENDYQDLSLGMLGRLGYDWDNITGQWAKAVATAQTFLANPGGDCSTNAYPAPIKCVDDAYYDSSGVRNDDLWGATLAFPIGDSFHGKVTGYGHRDKGQGEWYTPYQPSPNYGVAGATTDNAPISVRTTEYDIHRHGIVADFTWDVGQHTIGFGGWWEDNNFDQARRFYALNLAAPQRSSLEFQRNPFLTQWQYAYETKTTQGYLEDTWKITDALKLNAGFKSVQVKESSVTEVGSPVINGSIESKDGFLPQVGVTYELNPNHELFAGFAKNMRAFGAAHTGVSPFATTQSGFDAIKDTLKPEISKTFEAGWRFRADSNFQGQAALYYVKFDNRLIGTTAGAGIVGNPTILANAGSVTSKGLDLSATWKFATDWSLLGSYGYNKSTYDDDIRDSTGAVTEKIAGMQTVDSPKNLVSVELNYNHAGFFATLAGHYTGERFFTYTNDQSVPGYTIADLTAGYRFDGPGALKGLEIQVNVTNLFDKKYVSSLGTNGFGYTGDSQTLQVGAPRQAFVTVRKDF